MFAALVLYLYSIISFYISFYLINPSFVLPLLKGRDRVGLLIQPTLKNRARQPIRIQKEKGGEQDTAQKGGGTARHNVPEGYLFY